MDFIDLWEFGFLMEEGDFVDILCCDSGESFEIDCDDYIFRTFLFSFEL